jgi:hypothetical protein
MSDDTAVANLEHAIQAGLRAALGHLPNVAVVEHVRDEILKTHGILSVPPAAFVNDGKPGVLYTPEQVDNGSHHVVTQAPEMTELAVKGIALQAAVEHHARFRNDARDVVTTAQAFERYLR